MARQPDIKFSKFIKKYIMEDDPKTLIECGANDGTNGSIGYFYEKEMGYDVYNIEANPYAFEKLIVSRPNCSNVNFGISDKEEDLEFIFPTDGPNGLSAGRGSFFISEQEWKNEVRRGKNRVIKKINVKCKKTLDVIKFFKLEKIGIFILDIEGFEDRALKGMVGIKKDTLPKIFVIEYGKTSELSIIEGLKELGNYKEVDRYGNNIIFRLSNF